MRATPDRLADEVSIYPYAALDLSSLRSLLIFAPHPDDEVFGCGGLTALALDAGAQVRVVVVSDGGKGGDPGVRALESRRAALVLAGERAPAELEFWREPDRGVRADAPLVARMRERIEHSRADWVLVPSPSEIHPDHRAVCVAATEAVVQLIELGSASKLAFYEVGQALGATALVDITPVVERKRRAMNCFASQLSQQRYDEHVLALNRYRSFTLGAAVTHVEALQFPPVDELAKGLASLVLANARAVVQRLGLDT